ncbi:MAG TPA: nitrate reductase molybdenum cofactor assembly chaperone, partial [Propionibacteriaceae bacterium]|nr:nitrate reductase molybdenum cofactor assembly chaperone [Propionibacteriaceae bacterium]
MMFERFRGRGSRPALPEPQLRTAWQAVSLLLGYPSDELRDQLGLIRSAIGPLPGEVSAPLIRLIDHLEDSDAEMARIAYVDTFDHTRRCALHLTYFVHGDTRKRGVALVQFKQAYRRGGLEINDDELPDHLGVLLEFGALGDVDIAWKLLQDHRASIEVLRLALEDLRSPWADAAHALVATLPALAGDQATAVARLIEQGPPNEDVGMDAYALDPRLNPHPSADAE